MEEKLNDDFKNIQELIVENQPRPKSIPMITEQTYYTLTMRYNDFKLIECYEVLHVNLEEFRANENDYVVRIVYVDGEEEIEIGDLQYFNSKFQITEVKILKNKHKNNER